MATETLDAQIQKICFHKPSKFGRAGELFLIATTTSGLTVKGPMARPVLHSPYRFFGKFVESKDWGQAFAFDCFESLIEQSASGVAQHIADHVPNIGPTRAQAIVDHFGEDCLSVLRAAPERIKEVPGLPVRLLDGFAADLARHFEESPDPAAHINLLDIFREHRVPRKVVADLLATWGSDAPEMVRSRPYSILLPYPRMGWETVDKIALAPTLGYAKDGPDRQQAAILEALERIAGEGHTYAHRITVEAETHRLIAMRPAADAWEALRAAGKIVVRGTAKGDEIALASLDYAERSIALDLARLAAGASGFDFALDDAGLHEEQRAAVEMVGSNGVSILAGKPGTGKSWTTSRIVADLVANGIEKILVVCPTGKAAKREDELIRAALPDANIQCSTIHKALAPQPGSDAETGTPAGDSKFGRGRDEFRFAHNEGDPLEADFIVVGEASMADVKLFASLLQAIPTGCNLLIVGDPHQLPSVGPGSVLRDLLAAGLSATTLDRIVRSDGGGRVVRACHAIAAGRRPEPAETVSLPTENWIHIEVSDPSEIVDEIVGLHEPMRSFPNLYDDFQVVAPQHGGAIGTDVLNERLSAKLNPQPAVDDTYRLPFRVGDKVIRRKNGAVEALRSNGETDDELGEPMGLFRWQDATYTVGPTAVVNGDLGKVLDIVDGAKEAWVIVEFTAPARLVRLPVSEHHLQRAYAITVHSAQGSGWPVVICPISSSYFYDPRTQRGLWVRELVYTAISRAEQLLVTCGKMSDLCTAISRVMVGRRNTRLKEYVEAAMPELAMTACPF